MSYEDDLAYGDFHGQGPESDTERGFVGDVFHRIRGRHSRQQTPNQPTNPSDSSIDPSEPSSSQRGSGGGMSFMFDKLQQAVHNVGSEIKQRLNTVDGVIHSHTHSSGQCTDGMHDHHKDNRFFSFAPQRGGNDIKWYVDACGYMWAVSVALEQAKESIWILDWWLSPELYLRRPPAKFEQYRLDRMLQAAAERGVQVNIIVYKEVTQALTRKLLNPLLPDYLHSLLPAHTDSATKFLTRLGLDVTFAALEEVEETNPLIAPPISVSSSHTKHALEDLHKNICVFRHPDHLPDRQALQSSFAAEIQNTTMSAASLARLPGDALKAIYGTNESTVLYWAHHEKLCLVDGKTAFMGGLDLCYGRWDTNQHAIADVHPSNIDSIVFPGQDYNNARIMDFQDVVHWQNNKLDRTQSSRMGWSDVSLCLSGPSVWDLRNHFVQRWNFIYNDKYDVRKDVRYCRLPLKTQSAYPAGTPGGGVGGQTQYFPPPSAQGFGSRGIEEEEQSERGFGGEGKGRAFRQGAGTFGDHLVNRFEERKDRIESHYGIHHHSQPTSPPMIEQPSGGGVDCQLTRSCTKWSHGVSLEHSIANAYIETIRNSQHFVYIENQFFITATGDDQKPVKNMIGAAIVERIVRAARNGERFMMIIMIPAIPAFAGDLRSDEALSTRAIMQFQYNSINRGRGYSIYELIAREGVDPMQYIRFYNLRNYDRINASKAMLEAEQKSGVKYEEARKQYDETYGGGYAGDPNPSPGEQPIIGSEGAYGPGGIPGHGGYTQEGYGDKPQYTGDNPYQRYQESASQIPDFEGLGTGRWDTVSECYMLGGEDIRNVPWESGDMDEIDAFVSEELYIHTKLLIADDRTVICGSANLNDRSQLGDHDSEIAIVINDTASIDSYMGGQPWRASKFAASLRRQLFRKHLGLLRPQDYQRPDDNFLPIGHAPNAYDWGSPEDQTVVDPISEQFLQLWFQRAKTNTDVFARVFHPVPYDGVKTWKQYDDYYERFFKQEEKEKQQLKPSKYKWGHVVAEEFTGGVQEVKEVLSQVKGTLVEMPLLFLSDEDIAKEGLSLNAFTEEVYT